jgi:solute carrier family 25 carnitine/acylcarnitine transporter 20/29
LAGACIAPLISIVSTPFELLKTQMQLGVAKQATTLSAAKAIWALHGLRGLYCGHSINILREAVFLSAYFGTYEHTKLLLCASAGLGTAAGVPLAGGLAGVTGWVASFPLDCVRANIQARPPAPRPSGGLSSEGWPAVARRLLQERGALGLYRGLAPSVARAFIVSSSRFSVYELVLWGLVPEQGPS